MGQSGRQNAAALKAQGLSETEILAALDLNARFEGEKNFRCSERISGKA